MLCVGSAEIGVARQNWWAVFERANGEMSERTSLGKGPVRLPNGGVYVASHDVKIDLELEPFSTMEVDTPVGDGFTWTRKALANATGLVTVNDREYPISAPALIDDTAGYHKRHTQWQWSAGFGKSPSDELVAWNLVDGINDGETNSERSVWNGDQCVETEPVKFAEDLSYLAFPTGEQLDFTAEAERSRRENLLLIRSNYQQPFGTFSGTLPGVGEITNGFGVMEFHDVYW